MRWAWPCLLILAGLALWLAVEYYVFTLMGGSR